MSKPIRVSGKDGWSGIVHSWFGGPGETHHTHEITIRLDTGETVTISDAVLSGRPDGSYYVPLSLDEIRRSRPAERPVDRPADSAPEPAAESRPVVIPVIREELEIGKRTVRTGGVRIHKSAHDEEQTVDLPTIHERVEVERVPVNRVVEGPIPVRHIGDTIIVPVIEEVLVVQKQLRLVEELHIRKTRTEQRDPQTVMLRKEEAVVERLEGERERHGESQGGTDDLRAV